MDRVINARNVKKHFGDQRAVDGIDLELEAGSILGLIGPNGAGKTTLLRSLLGLCDYRGDIAVLGCNPRRERSRMMQQVCSITDTAVLPGWMKVSQLIDYVEGVHPRFSRERVTHFLAGTEVGLQRRVRQLSKGMIVQLHLALVMSIDARLLILDEPTLGLDVLFRKQFFEQLLNDYYDDQRTIIISTHQVEEVENILTDVMFMRSGKCVLMESMAAISGRYTELHAVGPNAALAESLGPVGQRAILGGRAFIFEDVERQQLAALGDLQTPTLADLFIAKVGGANAS
ncbi:MAG: ABC transporter ATP-binding protein [Pseudomonadales bacterium]|nr:ABC transporter ATP-binding protein [Halioglobus sp.]MCP5194973.1 ABC transporter ATP-binding protein [Pseudomonadales bacterium]